MTAMLALPVGMLIYVFQNELRAVPIDLRNIGIMAGLISTLLAVSIPRLRECYYFMRLPPWCRKLWRKSKKKEGKVKV